MPINLQSDHTNDDDPKRLFQRGLELDLVALVQAAAAWAAETGSAGDLMLSAALHRFDDSDKPVHLIASEHAFHHGPATPLPAVPAQTTGDLSAIVTDQREAVVVACALVSDLLADMGAHEPHVLTPKGEILIDRLEGLRHTAADAGGAGDWPAPGQAADRSSLSTTEAISSLRHFSGVVVHQAARVGAAVRRWCASVSDGRLLKYAAHETVAAVASALDRAYAERIPYRPATALRFAA